MGLTHSAVFRSSSLVIFACAMLGCAGGDSKYSSISCTPRADNLIVPGQRIGQLCLGMPLADLHRAMGEPSRIDEDGRSGNLHYGSLINGRVGELTAHFRADRVDEATVRASQFATREGLRVGSSGLAVRAALGTPERSADWRYCYVSRGVMFDLSNGVVSGIVVDVPPMHCNVKTY